MFLQDVVSYEGLVDCDVFVEACHFVRSISQFTFPVKACILGHDSILGENSPTFLGKESHFLHKLFS